MRVFIFFIFLLLPNLLEAQIIPAGFPHLEERGRRNQLINDSSKISFLIRPVPILPLDSLNYPRINYTIGNENFEITAYPIVNTFRITNKRPYGWGDYGMIPTPGFQWYASGGGSIKWNNFKLTFLPEVVYSQNTVFNGFKGFNNRFIDDSRFFYWNLADNPERFGRKYLSKLWLGQSSFTYGLGSFEFSLATDNIWWGPGQFNSLTFSNNAQGFPHLSINTRKPAKTFLGNFEGQVLIGRLENSGFAPSQDEDLNKQFFLPFSGDWRYLNAITLSYNPKWISGLYLGFSRTFQQYRNKMGNGFGDYFPIFAPFQKKFFFNEGGSSQELEVLGRDQTATLFFRWVFPKINAEFYAEFGRRDHAFNWRDAIMTPEHARAYLMGFNKLIPLAKTDQFIQLRGEMTHQQESINRYIRYPGTLGGISWHMHSQARGFVNFGQPLGVGIGTGSNVQTLEVSLVENFNKYGILLERLENQQDFYYRAFGQQKEHKPWVDLSLGFLFDHRWDNLLLSSKVQLIHGRNYQWQLDPSSTPDFPKGENLFSVHSQMSLVYFWGKQRAK